MSRPLHVLLIIEGEIATTQLIERVLLAGGNQGLQYTKKFLRELRPGDFSPDVLPVFVRCGDPTVVPWINSLVTCGCPYVYYIDDNFWQIDGDSPLARYYKHPAVRNALQTAISNATVVITNSPELSKFLHRFNHRIETLQPFFDFGLIEGICADLTPEIRIGFAGSPSRVDDLEILEPIIASILGKYPQVIFEFAGVMPRSIPVGERIRFFPHTPDYSQFVKFQAGRGWAIGLAPLRNTEANLCKTNNKYREYGACGIAGIYSDLSTYRQSVSHGVTGLFSDNAPEAWLSSIESLIRNADLRQQIAKVAKEDVQQRFCVSSVASQWFHCLWSARATGKYLQSKNNRLRPGVAFTSHLATRFNNARIQVGLAYFEGGIPLVFSRSRQKLSKLLFSGKSFKK